ncbi:flagellar basal body rod protein FlgB [Salinibius halmophilus]|uniref:flagellar basal body rod protein FlgB n=1 Tax=Salinibius halmophilus TaxID=1853216 RepID=UPI000E666219|nr:flagellar basal body rod protein FlgB [Salinibius halmophilus]
MARIGFEAGLGIHDDALLVRAERSEVLANNLANADTPGFKARDFDFKAVLNGEMEKVKSLPVERTNDAHIKGRGRIGWDMLYRFPSQPSIDGNTVDVNIENAEFTRNSLDYNASFEFLNSRFKGLNRAIKGQ